MTTPFPFTVKKKTLSSKLLTTSGSAGWNHICFSLKSIGLYLGKNFDVPLRDDMNNFANNNAMPKMSVGEDLVQSIVKAIDVHKSSAITNVNSTVLKEAFMVMIPQLTYMYNLSFTTNIFPDM